MRFALIKAPKAISAQCLHHAHINKGIEVLHEHFALKRDETGKLVEIVIEQLLAQFWRQIGLSVVQQRRDVILQRAFAAALVIQKKRIPVTPHDVARLEVAVEKVIAAGAQQEFRQAAEVVFQRLLVEWNAGEPEEVVLEVIQVPGDGLTIKAGPRITYFVIQIAAGFDLEARQGRHNFAIGLNGLRSDAIAGAILREKIKERRVTQVLFEISAPAQVL